MALLFVLTFLLCGNAVNGQFERMFQQNIVDNPPDTGKILIQSELKLETLVSFLRPWVLYQSYYTLSGSDVLDYGVFPFKIKFSVLYLKKKKKEIPGK